MLPHLARLVFGVQYGQLSEHAHVSPLQSKGCLQQSDELVEVSLILVISDEVSQLVCVDHNVQSTYLSQTELLRIDTGKTNLKDKRRDTVVNTRL